MAAPGVENKAGEIRGGGDYSNDYVSGPTIDTEWGGSHGGPAKEGKPLAPAAAPATPQGSPAKAPADAATPGGAPSSAAPSSAAAPAGASKDDKDDKDTAPAKPAGKPVEKGSASDEWSGSYHQEGGKYEHSEGSWGFEYKDGKDCEKCQGKKPEPKPSSTSCSTEVASATPPPPPPPAKSTPSCPLASNGTTPCAAPKTPQTPVAKTPEGETKLPPPAQVGGGSPSTPAPPAPSKPESPKTPAGAKPPPKSTPSKPVTFKNAAAGFAAAPLAQLAFFGVVSCAVAALIL
jgi:hypothetical protein